jgi:hypothetical protein
MKVRNNTQIKNLFSRFPSIEEVFSWHSIDLDDDAFEMTLEEIALEYDIDLEEFLLELQTHLDEEMEDEEDEEDEEDVDDEPSTAASEPVANLDDASLAESLDGDGDEEEDEEEEEEEDAF